MDLMEKVIFEQYIGGSETITHADIQRVYFRQRK